jgi:aspartate racemase
MGEHDHPDVSMHAHSLAMYMRYIDRDDWRSVGDLMLSSAEKLAAAGADLLVCPDNTIHQAWPYIAERSPRPWLHIAEVVAEDANARGIRKIRITGTRYNVDSQD